MAVETSERKGTITVYPEPIVASGREGLGVAKLHWSSAGTDRVEVHVGAPNGPLLSLSGQAGSAITGKWVYDGMTFFLQDVTGGKSCTHENTLSTATARVICGNAGQSGADRTLIESIKELRSQQYILWARFGVLSKLLSAVNPYQRPPVLIISIPRSGSSWVGETLGFAQNAMYLHEPINQSYHQSSADKESIFYIEPLHPPVVCKEAADLAFAGIPAVQIKGAVKNPRQWRFFARHNRHLVIKEVNPLACEWLIRNYAPQIIFLIRHPAAVALSHKKMGWGSDLPTYWRETGDYQGRALKGCLNALVDHPHRIIVKYEDLCLKPLEIFRQLYDFTGLAWSHSVYEFIQTRTKGGKPEDVWSTARNSQEIAYAWKSKFSKQQIEDVHQGYQTHDVPWYRAREDWEL